HRLPTGARPGEADGDEPPRHVLAASSAHDPRPRRPCSGDQPGAARLVRILHRVLPERGDPARQAHRSPSDALGAMEVQTTGTQRQEGASVATGRPNTEPRAVRALEVPHRRVLKPEGTSRMSREAHERRCGGRRVGFPPATRRPSAGPAPTRPNSTSRTFAYTKPCGLAAPRGCSMGRQDKKPCKPRGRDSRRVTDGTVSPADVRARRDVGGSGLRGELASTVARRKYFSARTLPGHRLRLGV